MIMLTLVLKVLSLEENYHERSRKRESYLRIKDNVYNLWKNRSDWNKYLRGVD